MARRLRTTALALALLIGPSAGVSQSASFPSSRLLKEPDAWYRSEAGKTVIDRVLSNQSDLGAWPKNVDTSAKPFEGNRSKIQGTFDNGATTGEVRFLARAFRLTGEERCRAAVVKAIDQILTAQYPTGGWPQFYPPGTGYHRHITFNDDTMVRLLELLREVGRSDEFASLDKPRREAALRAFNAGIRCIVRCQVVVDGKPTVWCAQHDEKTLEPRKGRTFEPISLSGSESAGILMLLMSLEKPDPEVVKAIEAGVRWFEGAKLVGIRLDRSGGDLKVVKDPSAPALWPRFVEIGTGRPIFSGRDGVIKYDIAEIDPERRNGYAWYGTWGGKVADRYARWRLAEGSAALVPGQGRLVYRIRPV